MSAHADAGRNVVDVSNLIRVEYDDNVFNTGEGVPTNVIDSFKITEQIELLFDTESGPTTFGFLYSPAFTYYTDRPDDDTDISHLFDLSAGYTSPSGFSIRIKDTFRRAEEPELVADDVQFRRNNDFIYNSLNATVGAVLVPEKMELLVDGRYAVTRYDEDLVGDASDYDQISSGVELVYTLGPDKEVSGQLNFTSLDYENGFRDSDAIQAGFSYVQQMTPTTRFDIRAGYETRDLDNAVEQESDSPYVDASIVTNPAANSVVTLGAGYSLDKSPVNTFAQQERLRFYATGNYSFTPALKFAASGSYSSGTFKEEDATSIFDPTVDEAGDEVVIQVSASLTYQLNVRNSIVATYQYTDLESDVRPESDYDRNRYSIGWQYDL